jgi:hypothetical protein
MRPAVWKVALIGGLLGLGAARAADSELGTWVSSARTTSLIIQARGKSRRLIYHAKGTDITLSVDTDLDGQPATVRSNGDRTGEKMSIRRVDDHHFTAVSELAGTVLATFDVAFSDDFNRMTVQSDLRALHLRHKPGKTTEVLIRK